MKGHEYRDLIAAYIQRTYGSRGIDVFIEIQMGKSIIGKNRKIDIVVRQNERILAIECKYQRTQGTTDEKIPYALQDASQMWVPAVVSYAGTGWSPGVRHLLEGHRNACYCLPRPPELRSGADTIELDHVIASVFGWWDVVLKKSRRFRLEGWTPPVLDEEPT